MKGFEFDVAIVIGADAVRSLLVNVKQSLLQFLLMALHFVRKQKSGKIREIFH
jgi:hypothetical protein